MSDLRFALLAGNDMIVQQAIGELLGGLFFIIVVTLAIIMSISGLWGLFAKAGKRG